MIFGVNPRLRSSSISWIVMIHLATHYMPFQKPSFRMIFPIASSAPEYCGDKPDKPATWSLRRRTSNGCVNKSEVEPAIPPQSSFRSARLASVCSMSVGRIYDLTEIVSAIPILRLSKMYETRRCRSLMILSKSASASPYANDYRTDHMVLHQRQLPSILGIGP